MPAPARHRARHRPAPARPARPSRPWSVRHRHWDRTVRPIRGRPGPRALRRRRASGSRGPRDRVPAALAEKVKDVVWGGTHGRCDPTRGVEDRQSEQYLFFRSCEMPIISASCVRCIAEGLKSLTYCCNSRLYICSVQTQHRLPRRTIEEQTMMTQPIRSLKSDQRNFAGGGKRHYQDGIVALKSAACSSCAPAIARAEMVADRPGRRPAVARPAVQPARRRRSKPTSSCAPPRPSSSA